MSCLSCSGFEHFTQGPPPTQEGGCQGKSSTNTCLYTAQGVFMCMKGDKPDINVKSMGVVDNESMMLEVTRDSSKFKNAAPW